jgi:hypothetical protein
MTCKLRGERGSAIVLAIALMTMMIAVGLAADRVDEGAPA